MEQLQTVLGWLQERGVVEAWRAADGRLRYRRLAAAAQLDGLLDDASRH